MTVCRSLPIKIFLICLSSVLTFDLTGDIDLLTLTSTQGVQYKSIPTVPSFRRSVCTGDINGDTIPDLVIGTTTYSPPSRTSAGAVYVIFGTGTGFSDLDLASFSNAYGIRIYGAAASDGLGDTVVCPGDLNGDNIGDIAIGATSKNYIYVIFGKTSGLSDIDLASFSSSDVITISGVSGTLGGAMSAADINNDGKKDLIIGGSTISISSRIQNGCVFVIYAQTTGLSNINLSTFPTSSSQGFKIIGTANQEQIGTDVGSAGDFNDDGTEDLVIGAYFAPTGSLATAPGKVFVIYGQNGGGITDIDLSSLPSTRGFSIQGANVGDCLGNSVSYAGDINGDNVADIVIGAPASRSGAGSSYVIFGKTGGYSSTITLSSFPSTTGFQIIGAVAGDNLGISVSSAGDLNNDGIGDILISAYQFDPPSRANAGAAYVIYGSTSTFSTIDVLNIAIPQGFKIIGAATADKIGIVVGSAGDINGDGYDDMIVRGRRSTTYGNVYLLYGGPISYKYWDNTYLSTCTFPLQLRVASGNTYCDYVCPTSSEYLYWDGTCPKYCNSPLLPRIFKNKLFCDYPCTDPSAYLYWDGTCRTSGCPSPMVSQDIGGNKLCKKPCSDDSLFYYPNYNKCREECPDPYRVIDMEYGQTCSNAPSTEDEQQIQNIAQAITVVTIVSKNSLFAVNIIFPSLSVAATSASLARLISYIRYLNISVSPRLQLLFNNTNIDNGGLPFVPDLPSNMKQKNDYKAVPFVFRRYNLSGSFLVNYWDALMSIVIAYAILLPFWLIDYLTRSRPRKTLPWQTLIKIRIIVQNLTLIQFYETFGDLVLFTLLEIHTQIFGSAEANLSLALSIICFLAAIGVLVFHFWLLRKYQRLKKTAKDPRDSEIEFRQKYSGFQVLFDDFKDTSILLQAFLLCFTIRDALFKLILILLYEVPFAQITLILALSLLVLGFLWMKRPYKERPELLQAMGLEIIFLMVNVSLFEMASLDINGLDYSKTHRLLGDVIIYCSLLCHFIPMLFIIVKIILLIKRNWSSFRHISVKAVVDIGMNIPIADLEEYKATHKQANTGNKEASGKAMGNTAKVTPISVDMDSPTRSLVKPESPTKQNEAKPKQQHEIFGSLTRTSLTSVESPLKRRIELRPTITNLLFPDKDPIKESETSNHLADDPNNKNLKAGLRPDLSAKRGALVRKERPLGKRQDNGQPSSTRYLLDEKKIVFSEDEEDQFVKKQKITKT